MSQQVNLYNPAFRAQRKYFLLPSMLWALGATVAGALLYCGYAGYQVNELDKQEKENTKRINAEQAGLERQIAEFSRQQTGQTLQDEVRRMEKLAADQAELIDAIKSGAVGNTTGYSEYMRAFARQVVPGLWLTGIRVTGDAVQVSLNGAATDPELLPVYIQRLSKESIMRGKTFSTLQMQQIKTEGRAGVENVAVAESKTENKTENKAEGKVETIRKSAPVKRYIEFTLHSNPENEVKK